MELTASELWSRVLDSARATLPEQTFRTWLAGSSAIAITEDELLVEVGSPFHVEWIEDKYGPTLATLIRDSLGRPLRLLLRARPDIVPPDLPPASIPVVESGEGPSGSGGSRKGPPPNPRDTGTSTLNDRYTFERFVVGNNNQLAAAACHAVAEKPARMYNPLFLYGGVGLGKTHLMHAVGNHIVSHDAGKRVAYVPSEQFMNQLVTSIQEGKTAEFRRRYRMIDLLLVDDVHFLEGKDRTQEEFFHTFNALYDAGKQIVLTSDRPPKEIPGLEDRLISRFEWGLVADIKPPDYETRVAILQKKSADDRIAIDPLVIDYIARSCTASVRELEGAVIKLLAYSSITRQEISLGMARAALEGVIREGSDAIERPLPQPEEIREKVAKAWSVTTEGLRSRKRTKDLTVPRQAAMYLMKELLDLSLVRIGEYFGGRDHSTVIHSLRVAEDRISTDTNFRAKIEGVRNDLLDSAR